eukprot:jgi/Phyca11/125249/e_gw1.57.65.1
MPSALPWSELAIGLKEEDADLLLETFKAFKISKSDQAQCTVCNDPSPHNMRKRILLCACRQCQLVMPYARCPWRGKRLQCGRHNVVDVFQTGAHVTARRHPRPPRLTQAMKGFAKEMADQGLKPARIRSGLLRKFELCRSSPPSLKVVQRFVNNYKAAQLGGNDYLDDLRNMVRESAFTGHEQEFDAFTFTWRNDTEGRPYLGKGSDVDPFLVGVTTKALLRKADHEPATFVLHIDATFKLTQVDYPVFVVGISDRVRKFHLLAIFISSQRQEKHFVEALMALRKVYTCVTGKQFEVRYAMGDADDAQYNAVQRVLGIDNNLTILMCFYHVAAKVYEKTKGLPPALCTAVARGLNDLHYATTEAEFVITQARVLDDWSLHPELASFKTYFARVWLSSRFCRWQIFHTPPAFATTNNPVESFNAIAVEPTPTVTLVRRASEMRRAGLLFEGTKERGTIAFLLNEAPTDEVGAASAEVVNVVSRRVARIYDPESKRSREDLAVTAQLGKHTARMEVAGMPATGWPVNTRQWSCPCTYWAKYGACVHTLLAKHVRGVHIMDSREKLEYRGPNRRKTGCQQAGRPNRNSPALVVE